jgi:hypothetical protein
LEKYYKERPMANSMNSDDSGLFRVHSVLGYDITNNLAAHCTECRMNEISPIVEMDTIRL